MISIFLLFCFILTLLNGDDNTVNDITNATLVINNDGNLDSNINDNIISNNVVDSIHNNRNIDLNTFKYYSQYQQDRIIYEYFFSNNKYTTTILSEIVVDKYDGIYVEIGAHNGIEFSNTKFFDDLG